MRLGNGKWETAKFNDRLQVTELALGNSSADASVWKVNYGYGEIDSNGNVDTAKNTGNIAKMTLSFAGLTNPLVQSFKYDSLYRLTEAKETANSAQNWVQNYGYDRFGNRLSFSQNIGGISKNTTPTIDANTNRFVAGQGFVYDKNGNITHDLSNSSQNRQFVFNAENKQTEVKDANGNPIGKYFYDGEGRRVKKVTDAETTVFVYSAGKLVAEYSTKLADNPSTNYMTTDHLGTPRVITNELGQVKSRRDFMPFGEELTINVGERSQGLKYGTADEIRQKFTGYQKDSETQLDFAEARMYENRYAKFTAVDPLLASGKSANPQTFNRFVYVLNNPIAMVDTNGLYPVYFFTEKDGSVTFSTKKWNKDWERYKGPKVEKVDTGMYGTAGKGLKYVITQTAIRRVEYFTTNKPPVEKAQAANQLDNSQKAFIAGADQGGKDAVSGSAKGTANTGIGAINALLFVAWNAASSNSIISSLNSAGIRPQIERYGYNSDIEARHGVAFEVGLNAAPGVVGGVFANTPRFSFLSAEARGSGRFFEGTQYTEKVLNQMGKGDFHSFPESVRAFESLGTVRSVKGADGITRQMLEIPGGYKNYDRGVFQFLKEPNGDINHRFFSIGSN
jgi:RHS repeat-associated protein